MAKLKAISFGTGQGYLKAGFLGFPKSGKTWTSVLLAVEVRKRLCASKGRIALFDSEGGGEYVAPLIRRMTGENPIGIKSRAFVDLLDLGKECADGAALILIVDSISHVWKEVCAAYLKEVNAARKAANKSARQRLEFQDWNQIKTRWGDWTDFYLNSPLHIIICGRAGFEWDFEEKENSVGGTYKELVKKGIKMKVESEFGFEPSLLVQMDRIQIPDIKEKNRFRLVHHAIVLGDRFGVMDGQQTDNPSGEWFAPHLDMLTPGATNVITTEAKTPMGVDESGNSEWKRERQQRTIFCEEIQGELIRAYPGQTAKEKGTKLDLIEKYFGTRSWTAVENMKSKRLKLGLDALRKELREDNANASG